MRVIGPISAQAAGELYARPVPLARMVNRVIEAERLQARPLPQRLVGDAAQLTLLMAQVMGRTNTVPPRRAAELYRRPEPDQPVISILA